ncbi:MAG: ion channel [Deinococcota bacterium]
MDVPGNAYQQASLADASNTDANNVDASNDVPTRDLGFGSVVTEQSRQRLLNRNGTFNVKRHGLGLLHQLNPYHELMVMPWWTFTLLVIGTYLLLNVLFAVAYWLCGEDAILGLSEGMPRFVQAFFLSVQTFASIGYGYLVPSGMAANTIATVEALTGLFAVALATGLIYARFSRPSTNIVFSNQAVVAPYKDSQGLMFRIVNLRKSQLIDLSARVILTRFEEKDGHLIRKFYPLELERPSVAFFPLSWTIVHPINVQSPLSGQTADDYQRANSEILILLTGIDETSFTTIQTRSSYTCNEVVWDARFENMFSTGKDVSIDVRKLSEIAPHAAS